jgi:hypothetical protein
MNRTAKVTAVSTSKPMIGCGYRYLTLRVLRLGRRSAGDNRGGKGEGLPSNLINMLCVAVSLQFRFQSHEPHSGKQFKEFVRYLLGSVSKSAAGGSFILLSLSPLGVVKYFGGCCCLPSLSTSRTRQRSCSRPTPLPRRPRPLGPAASPGSSHRSPSGRSTAPGRRR